MSQRGRDQGVVKSGKRVPLLSFPEFGGFRSPDFPFNSCKVRIGGPTPSGTVVFPPPSCFMNFARISRLFLVSCWIELSVLLAANPPSDFTLKAPVTGQTFRLSEAKGSYVVLQFLLKTECPVCLRHTRSHFLNAEKLKGTIQLFIKPDGTEALTAWARGLGPEPSPVIYQDPGAALATAFSIPDGYSFHGETVHYPALLILDPQGREVFRYVGKDNSDRYSVKQLNQKLAELQANSKDQP